VVFHEITRNAIREAVTHPRELSLDLVNAQQARRALDYLVGFNLSPLLWKKVRRGLSADACRAGAALICEREDEIAAFVAQEYWTIDAEGEHGSQAFPLKLVEFAGRKVEQFSCTTPAGAHAAVGRRGMRRRRGGEAELLDLAAGELHQLSGKAWLPCSPSASMVQYSCATKAAISSSRSQIMRSAGLCTRRRTGRAAPFSTAAGRD